MKFRKLPAFAALFLAAVAFAVPAALAGPDEDAAALEGGNPVPDGAMTINFTWMGKQSLTATSDAEERVVVTADTTAQEHPDLGSITMDGKGSGTGEFKVQVKELRSGHTLRDQHLQSADWLDAEKFPEVGLKITKLERVKPTVWRLTGTWTMHGIASAVTALVNVRLIPNMPYLGDNIVRVKTSFNVSLKAHGVKSEAVGSPMVAESWKVDVVVLGVTKK